MDSMVFLSTSSQKRIRETKGSFEIIKGNIWGIKKGGQSLSNCGGTEVIIKQLQKCGEEIFYKF